MNGFGWSLNTNASSLPYLASGCKRSDQGRNITTGSASSLPRCEWNCKGVYEYACGVPVYFCVCMLFIALCTRLQSAWGWVCVCRGGLVIEVGRTLLPMHAPTWHLYIRRQTYQFELEICTFPFSSPIVHAPYFVTDSFSMCLFSPPHFLPSFPWVEHYKISEPELNTSSLSHCIATRIATKDLLWLIHVYVLCTLWWPYCINF